MPLDAVCPATPSGLKLAYEVLTEEEEAELIELIEASQLIRKAYDPGNARSSASFGWTYDFARDTFAPCAPIPEGFQAIRETAAAFAGVAPADLAECLLNRYDPGAVIQPHQDKPVWDRVIGISLGSSAPMEFRRDGDGEAGPVVIELPPRSIYLLAGDARHVFTHALPPMERTRWSITFRSYSQEGRRLRKQAASAA